MFGALKAAHKLGAVGAKWASATGVDPGDNGQVAKLASQYIANLNIDPEDAWVSALVTWMNGMPWPDSKLMVAEAMLRFLDAYEGKIALSAATIIGARCAAEEIIG
jgi:hypothetical protein